MAGERFAFLLRVRPDQRRTNRPATITGGGAVCCAYPRSWQVLHLGFPPVPATRLRAGIRRPREQSSRSW